MDLGSVWDDASFPFLSMLGARRVPQEANRGEVGASKAVSSSQNASRTGRG